MTEPASDSPSITVNYPSLPGYPDGYTDDGDVRDVLECLRDYYAPLLVTGKAGTGKSTLVRYIRDCGLFENTIVLAPTGVAALHIGGQTLHSFFRLPHRIFTDEVLKEKRYNRMWKKADIIIVDEVSMVRPDIIDGMDAILRRARHIDKPFGGCRLMFIGDFYQLPPVVAGREAEMLRKLGYDSPFAYSAKILSDVELQKVTLHEVHRQRDEEFLNILSHLRMGTDVVASVKKLNAECFRPPRAGSTPVLLTGTNATALRYNLKGLAAIPEPVSEFSSAASGNFGLSGDRLPAPETLVLKNSARVMALKNDPNKRWVNGSLGTVTEVGGDYVNVRFDHTNRIEEVKSTSWETVTYDWDEKEKKPIAETAGTFSQIPLMLAWAMTIHKAQGLTLDDVRIDLEGRAFASGQAYVALSRARTLEGLSLARPLKPDDIMVEAAHDEYFGNLRDEWAEEEEWSEAEYQALLNAPQLQTIRAYSADSPRLPVYAMGSLDEAMVADIALDFARDLGIEYRDESGAVGAHDITAHYILREDKSRTSYLVAHDHTGSSLTRFDIDRIVEAFDLESGATDDGHIRKFLNELGG